MVAVGSAGRFMTRIRALVVSVLMLASVLLLPHAARAQQASGIAGVVKDTSGAVLPGVTIDEKRIVSSTGAVTNEARPGSLIVIGAGAVGIEFADVYAAYGAAVTVLEALPRVLPIEDEEASAQIARLFSRRDITIRTGVKVKSVTPAGSGVRQPCPSSIPQGWTTITAVRWERSVAAGSSASRSAWARSATSRQVSGG